MPEDELETILRLVAEGHLTSEDAAPIVETLQAARRARDEAARATSAASERTGKGQWQWGGRAGQGGATGQGAASGGQNGPGNGPAGASGRRMRVQVRSRDRSVVDIRVPLALAGLATDSVPGLSDTYRERIRAAIAQGITGPIVEIRDDEGEGEVRIVVE